MACAVRSHENSAARASERALRGRSGVYDVTVRRGATVVAEFVGRSLEIRGTLFDEEGT